MKHLNKIVIIGAGHAGVQAAASLRENKYLGDIFIFDKDSNLPYQKPPLSKKFLLSEENNPSLLRSEEWYKNNNIKLLKNNTILKIDRIKKNVINLNGTVFHYDKLIIATGSKNKILDDLDPEEYLNLINLRTLNDSVRLKNLILKSKNIVIIGAGFIGLEVAASARSLGKNVTILESDTKVMGRNISDQLSKWYIQYHKKKGVNFLFDETITSIKTNKKMINSIQTSKKNNLKIDCLLTAIGSYPDTTLANAIDLEVNNGICVNQNMQTNDPSIYAIGDCTNFVYGSSKIRLESIQNAVDQSKTAALNILNIKDKYIPTPWFWTDQFDLKLQIVGLNTGNNSNQNVRTLGSKANLKFSNFIFENEKLISIESVNSPAHHLLLRNNSKIWRSIKPSMIFEDLDLKLFLKKLAE
tara:strand:+ start:259 stop:1497 length:1239 start_codon:yes stop_codon:yes gene_type:complete